MVNQPPSNFVEPLPKGRQRYSVHGTRWSEMCPCSATALLTAPGIGQHDRGTRSPSKPCIARVAALPGGQASKGRQAASEPFRARPRGCPYAAVDMGQLFKGWTVPPEASACLIRSATKNVQPVSSLQQYLDALHWFVHVQVRQVEFVVAQAFHLIYKNRERVLVVGTTHVTARRSRALLCQPVSR